MGQRSNESVMNSSVNTLQFGPTITAAFGASETVVGEVGTSSAGASETVVGEAGAGSAAVIYL